MKTILIVTDLEGISGVSGIEQITDTDNGGYRYACSRLMADTNAAVCGAFDGGADRVLVEDGHGTGVNFLPGMLDPRAEQINVASPDFSPEGISGLFEIGAHAMAGTVNAFLDHTQSSVSWHDYFMNGIRIGELAQMAAFTGAFGVPCVMVSGDRAACREARDFFGTEISCAEVKWAKERNHAVCIPDAEAEKCIYLQAKASMALLDRISPYRVRQPMELRLTFNRTDYCDALCANRSDLERLDARTVRRTVKKIRTFMDVMI